jgi:exodeoxyribonuclease VII large subunit
LRAFNDERVARTIYRSRVPVISAVGHETDFTIADFVADLRAPTPSAAAELVAPDVHELRITVQSGQQRLTQSMQSELEGARSQLAQLSYALERNSPQASIENDRQRIDDLTRRLFARARQLFALRRETLVGTIRQIAALNPEATLARGYAIVREKKSGRVVKSKLQISGHTEIQVRVLDGDFDATTSI